MAKILVKRVQIRPTENLNDVVAVFDDSWTPNPSDLENCVVIEAPQFTVQEIEDGLESILVRPGPNDPTPKYCWNLDLLTQDDLDFIQDSLANNKVQRMNRLKQKIRQNTVP